MLLKNVLGLLIIISNLVGIILICMNTTITKFVSRKKKSSSPVSPSSELQNEQAIKDDLLKDLDLSQLDDLNLDDFD